MVSLQLNSLLFGRNAKYSQILSAEVGEYFKGYQSFHFRRGPVHGIHKVSGGYCGFRNFSTFQECKYSLEYPEYVRSARNANNLPDSYADIQRYVQRSWKEQGKMYKQWDRKLPKNWRSANNMGVES